MSDIDFRELDPEELADQLDSLAAKHAKKTGEYDVAAILINSAEWLRHHNEKYNGLAELFKEKVDQLNRAGQERYDLLDKIAAMDKEWRCWDK